jgi:hypothetical protein
MVIIATEINRELIARQFFAMFTAFDGNPKNFARILGFSLTTSPNAATE